MRVLLTASLLAVAVLAEYAVLALLVVVAVVRAEFFLLPITIWLLERTQSLLVLVAVR
jgi:hypothetical protein